MVSRHTSLEVQADQKTRQNPDDKKIVKALRRRLDAQQKLVDILKERVQTANTLLESEKRSAETYEHDALQSREAELAKTRFELAQERIQRAELDFIAKSLRVELDEERIRHHKVKRHLATVQEQMEDLQDETDQLREKINRLRIASEKSQGKLDRHAERERRLRANFERKLQQALDRNEDLRHLLADAKKRRDQVNEQASKCDDTDELELLSERVMRPLAKENSVIRSVEGMTKKRRRRAARLQDKENELPRSRANARLGQKG
mmetsp:Transcript_12206/g.37220  ORF Transcript_12206/g.37220 Transcript_12206/m.37220 type:complete len:264 (-) Transcript_12206:695-1486(-)